MKATFKKISLVVRGSPLTVSYLESGEELNPSVVLLHALGNDASTYELQFGDFSNSHRVLAIDFPGYGSSDTWPFKVDSIDPFCDVVAEVLAKLKIQEASFVGSSFGSLVALSLAASRADLVSSVVLSSPSIGLGALPLEKRNEIYEQRSSLAKLPAQAVAAKMAPMLVSEGAPAEVVQLAQRQGERLRPEGFLSSLQAQLSTNGLLLAKKVVAPVLLLVGEADRMASPKDAGLPLADTLANADLRLVPGVGHSFHIEQPKRFNEEVLSFLSKQTALKSGEA